MRSVTSWFNPTLYKKNMARFWPLWGLYLFCGLCVTAFLMVQKNLSYAGSPYQYSRVLDFALELPCMLVPLVWMSVCYAPLCAMAVYDYLYNHRSSCGIHAMPLSRDTLYVTNFLSGASFFLLPNVVITVATALTEGVLLHASDLPNALGRLALVCVVLTGVELFFFGFASLCAMVTGNLIALPALYAIFNALVIGMYALIQIWCELIFFGYSSGGGISPLVEVLTPVYKLSESCEFVRCGEVGDTWTELPLAQHLHSPGTVAAYALAGLVLGGLGWLLYRKRHLESAGDVVAFLPLYPLFRVGVGVCAGLAGGTAMTALFSAAGSVVLSTLFFLLWTAIGYFAAEMLLQKSFRVWKAWLGCAVLLVGCLVISLTAQLDLLGGERKVPNPHEVEEVYISISPAFPDYEGEVTTDNPAIIAAVVDLHQTIVDNRDQMNTRDFDWNHYAYVTVEYSLPDGMTLARNYHGIPFGKEELSDPGSLTSQMEGLLQDETFRTLAYDVEELSRDAILTSVYVEACDPDTNEWYSEELNEDLDLLWNAVKLDFRAGNLGTMSLFDSDLEESPYYNGERRTHLGMNFLIPHPMQNQSSYRHLNCSVGSEAVHTLHALELLGVNLSA